MRAAARWHGSRPGRGRRQDGSRKPEGEANNEGEAHGNTVDEDRNAIVFSTTCVYVHDPIGCKIQERIGRVAG